MTQVCLVGDADVNLRYELVSRETAREALATYDLQEPYENTVTIETVSLGAAVATCNDLDWYLVRFASDALIFEPSVSESEWLSRELATQIRNGTVDPDESGRYLKVYGIEAAETAGEEPDQPPRLVEPMFVARTGATIPAYDLREVEETLTVRVTESEFEA